MVSCRPHVFPWKGRRWLRIARCSGPHALLNSKTDAKVFKIEINVQVNIGSVVCQRRSELAGTNCCVFWGAWENCTIEESRADSRERTCHVKRAIMFETMKGLLGLLALVALASGVGAQLSSAIADDSNVFTAGNKFLERTADQDKPRCGGWALICSLKCLQNRLQNVGGRVPCEAA